MASSFEKAREAFEKGKAAQERSKTVRAKMPEMSKKTAAQIATEQLNSKYGAGSIDTAIKHLYKIAVLEGGEDYKGRLPEEIFVNYFLPYFKEPLNDKSKVSEEILKRRDKMLREWIAIAGSLFSEVDIIDVAGKVLFTVPALNNTNVINPIRSEGAPSFETIANMAERLQMLSPAKSVNYQNERLQDKLEDMSKGRHKFTEIEKRWISIFERYPDTKSNSSNSSGNKTSSPNDDLSDDDFLDV